MSLPTRLLLRILPLVPTPVMRRLAGRYIAGERLEPGHEITGLGVQCASPFRVDPVSKRF